MTSTITEHRDELPEDLDARGYVGPYLFPDNARRRIPAFIYLGFAVLLAAWWFSANTDSLFVNRGTLVASVFFLALGLYSLLAAPRLKVREFEALKIAAKAAGVEVGPASAQLGWRGLRSRPTWRVLIFSGESADDKRAFAMVDGVDGQIVSLINDAGVDQPGHETPPKR